MNKNRNPYPYQDDKRYLSFDTNPNREGLHVYMCDTSLSKKQKGSAVIPMANIHLDRQQCLQLINDIKERLF